MGRLDEIEQRLQALPAPRWESENGEIIRRWEESGADTLLCYPKIPTPDMVAQFRSPADLTFIAAAPDDVRWLVSRVRTLEEGLRDLEWRPILFDERTLSNYRLCHQCNRYEQNGHAADCPLAALLARAGES